MKPKVRYLKMEYQQGCIQIYKQKYIRGVYKGILIYDSDDIIEECDKVYDVQYGFDIDQCRKWWSYKSAKYIKEKSLLAEMI